MKSWEIKTDEDYEKFYDKKRGREIRDEFGEQTGWERWHGGEWL